MSYSEFMLCNLLRDINDSFNNLEYDCVHNFLKSSQYKSFNFN